MKNANFGITNPIRTTKDCSMCEHSWENHGDGKSPCFWVELDENSFSTAEFCNCEWFTVKMTFNK